MIGQMGELMNIIGEIQSESLDIKHLDVVVGHRKDGVMVVLTSPDEDGAKMAKLLGRLFGKFPEMIKSQNPNIKITFREGNIPP